MVREKLQVLRVITSINLWSQQQQRLSGIYIVIWEGYKNEQVLFF